LSLLATFSSAFSSNGQAHPWIGARTGTSYEMLLGFHPDNKARVGSLAWVETKIFIELNIQGDPFSVRRPQAVQVTKNGRREMTKDEAVLLGRDSLSASVFVMFTRKSIVH
jgi:hypothetical protein